MDFSIPEATQDRLDHIRAFLQEHVLPLEPVVLANGFPKSQAELQGARQKAKDAGLWGPQLPEDIGGLGLSLLEHGLVSEVLGYSPLGHYVLGAQAPDAGNIEVLHKYGTAEQKARYLAPLADGEIRSCFSMTEPDSPGSNPTQLECRAERDGDHWVLNGRKWFTSSADGAAFAIVMAVTNPDAPPHMRASMIIVPTDAPGFNLVRNIPVFGHAGGGYDSHAEIAYENCRVPIENLLGPENAGFVIAQERLGPGRIHHCMRWIGICERAFETMCARAVARKLGPGETLADKQIIQAWVAESRAQINAARLMVLQAAWKIDHEGFRRARQEVSIIKFYVANVMMQVIDRAIQVHGALGITNDTILAHYYTQERGARIYDGPDEVHKMVVARRIFRDYRARAPQREQPRPSAERPPADATARFVDKTAPVRDGEGLPLEALGPYLRERLDQPASAQVVVEQFPGGHSNLTYLLRVGDREVVLRRPPFGTKVKRAHDMGREHRVLSALSKHWPLAPAPLFYCTDESVIGAEFYGMERRRGVILRRRPPRELMDSNVLGPALSRCCVDTLADLHNLDYAAAGLGDLGKPEGYVERQVSGWTKRYFGSKTDEIPAVETVATWLKENMPKSGPPALIHNDFKFDNMVLDPGDLTRVTAVLDWEMATVGDPLMDLGTALCYWIERDDPDPMKMISFGPTTLPGFWTRKQVAARYAEKTGRALDDIVFYYCFGLFKTAVVTQQIYYRFAKGLTQDPRFAMMIEATKILSGQAERYLGAKSL